MMGATKALRRNTTMIAKGRRLSKFLIGYRLLGVDPGYLFVPVDPNNHHGGIDLPEEVVDGLLERLENENSPTTHAT